MVTRQRVRRIVLLIPWLMAAYLAGVTIPVAASSASTPVAVIPTPVLVAQVNPTFLPSLASSPTGLPRALASVPAFASPTAWATDLPPSSSATPLPTALPVIPVPTPSGSSPVTDAKQNLLATLQTALSKIKTYRVQVPSEFRLIEVVLPDRFHQLETWDTIWIGNKLYRRIELDWVRAEVTSVPFFDKANIGWYAAQFAQSPTVTFLGPSTLETLPAVSYQSTVVVGEKTEPVKIWFDTVLGVPLRVDVGVPGASSTILFYDFNAEIKIDPPF